MESLVNFEEDRTALTLEEDGVSRCFLFLLIFMPFKWKKELCNPDQKKKSCFP